jgi:hypothetical protein
MTTNPFKSTTSQIVPSLLSADFSKLASEIAEVDDAMSYGYLAIWHFSTLDILDYLMLSTQLGRFVNRQGT